MRQSIYAHLQRLSMSYYDRHQIGRSISTITDDVNAVQDFVSTSLLDILIDSLTIVGMLAVMFSLNWSFTLIALAVAPSSRLRLPPAIGGQERPTTCAAARASSSPSFRRGSAPSAS